MGTGDVITGDNPVMDKHPIQGGVKTLLVPATETGNKRRSDGLLGWYADLT